MSLYQNKFRVQSARLKEWDYANPWWYFVTINTKSHKEYFGMVEKGKMLLNVLGKIAKSNWMEIPIHFKNIELDYFVIMPNHVHGIIIINPTVETPYMASLQLLPPPKQQSPSLGEIIGKYKAAVTRWAGKNGIPDFSWQSRFYDRIIRNEKELFFIRRYIQQNPLKWGLEKKEPENIFAL